MFMKWIAAVIGGSLFLGICCISCVEYTPKPRGYVRIEPSKAQYKPLDLSYLPFNFDVSQTAVIEVPDQKKGVTGLNISYPMDMVGERRIRGEVVAEATVDCIRVRMPE